MKRRDDNRQLRPEEVEALNDVNEEAGSFSRASSEVLASRRIVKSKRSSLPASDASNGSTNPFSAFGSLTGNSSSTTTSKSHPFANLKALSSENASTAASATAPAWKMGLPGAAKATTQSPIKQKPASFETETKEPLKSGGFGAFGGIKKDVAVPSSNSNGSSEMAATSSNSKIQKLNKSFLSWMDRQIVDHPVSVWTAGLQDYLKYADKIAEQTPTPSSNTASEIAPASAVNSKVQPSAVNGAIATQTAPAAASAPASSTSKPSFGFLTSAPTKSTAAPTTIAPAVASAAKPSFGGFSGFKGFGAGGNVSGGAAATKPAAKPFGFAQVPSAGAVSGGGEEGGDDDEEAEPVLEPEEVLKNAKDTDEILYETNCKLFRYNKETKEWKENGKGVLRVTVEPGKSVKRILIRNTVGKITVNANICKGMNFKKSGKNGIQFMTVNETGSLTAYMAKVRVESLEESFQFLSKAELES